ncbi:DDB1- and CUL4-associated factor 15-like, partial [Homarus americanus]
LYGETRQTRTRPRQRLFYQLPHRLAFSLAQVAPPSALAAGHVFLGFTKCGQFVLSYTHSCDTDDHTLQMIHRYRLHWWVFVPYAPLRKVAEVMLFGDQDLQESLYENFFISLCQWPRDLSKILVYGCSMIEGGDGGSSQTRRCYITITAVPSLDNCSACYQVATSYEEDDLAERWNSCVRFSCLKHGITVHTSFEMVPPFPKFLPSVQMKRKGFVVLNAGNFIHVLNVDLENMDRKMKEVETEILGVRLNGISAVAREEEEESDDDREQNKVKNRRVSGEQYSVPNLRSGKVYNMTDSSSSDVDPEADGQSSCEEEEITQVGKEQNNIGLVSSGLKITLNSGGRLGCSSSMTDRDREWEILIGNLPPTSEERTRNEDAVSVHVECRGGQRGCVSDGQSVSHYCDNENCDNRNRGSLCGQQNSDAAMRGVARNLTLKEFQLPDDSPYHFYGESDCFIDNDSDDSTRCSHISEDSRLGRSDLRDSSSNVDRCRAGVNCCGNNGIADDFPINSQHSQQQSRMVLRSSSESSYGEKTPTKQAEKEYEFIDEITDSRHEKLSVFRRRRLADKKYEFSDENMENVPQKYSSYRSQSRRLLMSPSRSPRFRSLGVPLSELSIELGESSGLLRSVYEKLLSPNSGSGSPNDVLRPINQNITSPVLSPRDDRWREEIDRLEKAELQRWSSRESLGLYALSPGCVQKSSERSSNLTPNSVSDLSQSQSLNCVVDFNRRYIEVDDELVSIITDIEDDELGTATGYHNALPLEVHGSGYTQMHMISNSKAEKLMAPGVLVRQVSLDVEQFCHEMAQRLCTEAGKKYFFCNDYNVEIVDVCPSSGDIVALASVLVQAATVVKGLSKTVRSPLSSLTRRQYKTTATFIFNMDTKHIETLEGDVGDERWWLNARQTARQLRQQWTYPTDYYSSVKVMTNEPLLKGKSLNHIMEGQHLIALVLGPHPQG